MLCANTDSSARHMRCKRMLTLCSDILSVCCVPKEFSNLNKPYSGEWFVAFETWLHTRTLPSRPFAYPADNINIYVYRMHCHIDMAVHCVCFSVCIEQSLRCTHIHVHRQWQPPPTPSSPLFAFCMMRPLTVLHISMWSAGKWLRFWKLK